VEVRRASGRQAGVHPFAHDLGIGHDLVGEPEERDVGELVEQMIADAAPGAAAPPATVWSTQVGLSMNSFS
jgi:hypothetical protein